MSSINTQFSVAVHLMAGLGAHPELETTSSQLALSVNAHASFVRRILAKLSKVGLVQTSSGKSGSCTLTRDPRKISLFEIYQAIGAPKVFAIHEYPTQKNCPISCSIKASLEKVLEKTTGAVEKSLKSMNLAQVIAGAEINE